MIISFSVSNFRSIREKQTFSMLASSTKSKSTNTFEYVLANGDTIHLLKTVGIFGGNAAGKSNLIHALFNLRGFIKNSADLTVDKAIPYYDPFLFHTSSQKAASEFEIVFLGKDRQKYKYYISFNAKEIFVETLDYYPKNSKQNIFKRPIAQTALIHTAKLGKNFGNKEYEIFKNQLLLSKFGKDIPNEQLSYIYLYFDALDIWNVSDIRISMLKRTIVNELKKTENVSFFNRLNKLIRVADTKINEVILDKTQETDTLDIPELNRKSTEELYAKHNVYDDTQNKIEEHNLPFKDESVGTNYLFALGGLILQKLEKGGVVVFDEFDNSLHPLLSRFLVQLCNNPKSNPDKAQLIFMSHEPTMLDKNLMRADQIWFAEKNNLGETQIYSAQDFEGVREDIPFDKWYLAGKFGAIPHINESEIQSIFEND